MQIESVSTVQTSRERPRRAEVPESKVRASKQLCATPFLSLIRYHVILLSVRRHGRATVSRCSSTASSTSSAIDGALRLRIEKTKKSDLVKSPLLQYTCVTKTIALEGALEICPTNELEMRASRKIRVSQKPKYQRSAKSGTPQSRRLRDERSSFGASLCCSSTAHHWTQAGDHKNACMLFIVVS